MASTITVPHFINYPGVAHGTIPPLNVQINPQFTHGNLPATPMNRLENQEIAIPFAPVGGGCYNDGMEVVWNGEFSRLFSGFYPPHVWYMTITDHAPPCKWKFHRDSAKVRFCCQDCGNGWTSMKGRVTFWFHLDRQNNAGFMQFKLYGQQCKKCNSGKFEYVMWYPEEVSKVMCNVYNKVGQTYYGFQQPRIRIDRRPGRPRNQHNAELCQACRDGECDQARPIKTSFIPNPIEQLPTSASAFTIASLSFTTTSTTKSTPQGPPTFANMDQASTFNEESLKKPALEAQSLSPVLREVPRCEPASKSFVCNGPVNTIPIPTPITESPGMQQIITYSLIGSPPMPTSLSPNSTQFVPRNIWQSPITPQYIYHPHPLISGTIPVHPPTVYPMLPSKPMINPSVKPLPQPYDIQSLTMAMESIEVSDTPDLCKTSQTKDIDKTKVDNSQNGQVRTHLDPTEDGGNGETCETQA